MHDDSVMVKLMVVLCYAYNSQDITIHIFCFRQASPRHLICIPISLSHAMLVRMHVLHKCVPWQGYLAIHQKNQQYVGSGQCTYVHLYCIHIVLSINYAISWLSFLLQLPCPVMEMNLCAHTMQQQSSTL